jgi:chromate transporter
LTRYRRFADPTRGRSEFVEKRIRLSIRSGGAIALGMAELGERTDRAALWEVARVFLRLGAVSFGGPAAHVALMEEEIVRRRRWLTREKFLDLLGAANLIPGPNSTELAIHVGYERAGWPGLIVAGTCFIVPATVIVGLLAWGYVRYGSLPAIAGILAGVKPVVIAIVAQAVWNLGRGVLSSRSTLALGIGCLIAATLGVHELALLALAGATMWALATWRRRDDDPTARVFGVAAVPLLSIAAAPVVFSLGGLFLAFLKIGSVLFGSGYVLLAFLRADFVVRLGWLSEQQLLDAVAVGQATPGPVFTTATFVGYLLGGAMGAVVATIGIFLPAFIFVALSGPLLPRVRRSPGARAALDGVNVASLALMAAVTLQLARSALGGPAGLALAVASAVALLRFRVGAAWLVLAGALLGLVATLAR